MSLFLGAPALAADITAVRSWRAPDNTRLVLDLSGAVTWQVSPESTPARLVLDIEGARLAGPVALPAVQAPLKALRFEPTARGQRLIIETALELLPKAFQLAPNEKYGHRLVVDLYEKGSPRLALATLPAGGAIARPADAPAAAASTATPAAATKAPSSTDSSPPGSTAAAIPGKEGARPGAAPGAAGSTTVPAAGATAAAPAGTAGAATAPGLVSGAGTTATAPTPDATRKPGDDSARPAGPEASPEPPLPDKYDRTRYRDIVVAIDAGHGGEDPGAIGKDGTYEKHITLAIAKELQARLESEPGITAVLTRTGDYFLPLQDRRRIARYQHKADIFVSIHADAAENRAARGASVFALSLKGAGSATSRFARMLAERENRADLIGGANLENEDNVLRNVLADMVVAGSLEHSLHMGRNILQGLERLTRLHSPRVEQAGFAVLKEPGMVSLLVETGFISNPDEEKKLTNKGYQQELASVIAAGVRRYCAQYPVPSTYFAWRADRDRARLADSRGPRRAKAADAARPEAARGAAEPAKPDTSTRSAGLAEPPTQAPAVTPAPVLVSAGATPPRTGVPGAGERPATALRGNGAAAEGARRDTAAPGAGRAADKAPRYRTHKVARGDSLTRLAAQYGVTMTQLRDANRLRDDNIQIGQTLKIPAN